MNGRMILQSINVGELLIYRITERRRSHLRAISSFVGEWQVSISSCMIGKQDIPMRYS